ncbi:MAG: hypothetical protein AAF387_15360, partial [Pseudomonadota bacterium]
MATPNNDYYRWKYFTRNTVLDDFEYGNEGPWPQPAPDHPMGQLAQVLHLPERERDDWKRNVSRKYLWLFLTRWPLALWRAWKNKHYTEITDERFDNYLTNEMYSRYLSPLDNVDEETFAEYLDAADEAPPLKCDFICMESIKPTYDGMFTAATVVLLRKKNGGSSYKAVAINYPDSDNNLVIARDDGESWRLSKYFVLQGASHRINLITHAALHFPFDPINAITKSAMPKDHLLFRLLIPHFRLALPVNHSVLEGDKSLISRTTWTIWAPFCAPGLVIRNLFPYGYVGDDARRNAYPEYKFPLSSDENRSQYFEFLNAYRATVKSFIQEFADLAFKVWFEQTGNTDWNYVSYWADNCAQWVPGFPNGEEIADKDTFIEAITTIIWDLAISHSTDHDSIHQIPNDELVFRLRLPPPTSKSHPHFELKQLCNWIDLFKANLTDILFYKPHNV